MRHAFLRIPCLLLKSQSPLPTRSLRLPTSSASCPSLRCNWRKRPVSCREAEGLYHGVVVSRTCWGNIPDLRLVPCDHCKTMNSFGDWVFNHGGWEVGLPAFQLPMFAECDYCRCQQEIRFTCLSRIRNQSVHSLPVALMFPRAGFLQNIATFASWRQLCSKRAAVSTIVTSYHFRPSHPVNRR